MTNDEQQLVRHVLATIAYRGGNVLRDLPPDVAVRRPTPQVRTPHALLAHCNDVLGFLARELGADVAALESPGSWDREVERFRHLLRELDDRLAVEPCSHDTLCRTVQGPLADVLTHLGQIGIFRRMAGSPVAAENYFAAAVETGRVDYV